MDDLFPTNLPATALQSRRLRLVEVIGDGMQPTLRPRDFALCKPTTRYEGEGIYLVSNGVGEEFFRVDAILGSAERGTLRLMRDNRAYTPSTITVDQFEERALAIVVADVKVRCPSRLAEALHG